MSDPVENVKALTEAFEVFTRSTQSLEEAYRLLDARAQELSVELAARNRELALINDYLDSILESMSDGVIAVDVNGVITKFNRGASVVLGYTAEEVAGRAFFDVFGREFSCTAGLGSMKLLAANGREMSVSERDAPISDRAHECIGYVKVFQDLTEIEALREQVRQMDRLAAIGGMAATVAHEIRNPLGGIRGFAALLARDIPPEDPRSRLVEKILVGTKNLNKVVDELLEYTRPVDLMLGMAPCADVVDVAISYLEIGDRPITVSNHVPRDLMILLDADKIRQVLLNMLINAAQSIQGPGAIEISASVETETVTVAVHDTGCGIPRNQLKEVFSPFYTTKEKGTGLGLAIAAKIVEGHGGRLEVDSEVGKGSTFLIRLPKVYRS